MGNEFQLHKKGKQTYIMWLPIIDVHSSVLGLIYVDSVKLFIEVQKHSIPTHIANAFIEIVISNLFYNISIIFITKFEKMTQPLKTNASTRWVIKVKINTCHVVHIGHQQIKLFEEIRHFSTSFHYNNRRILFNHYN